MRRLSLVALAGVLAACSSSSPVTTPGGSASAGPIRTGPDLYATTAPSPDPRVGLAPGLFDAEEAIWNLRKLSSNAPPEAFLGVTNSDLAFKGDYAFQGNYNGIIVWDLSNPASPEVVMDYVCPASQSDVSVYGDLMFVSGEGLGGRLDCGTEGVREQVSSDRLRGIRIFNIADIRNPEYIANVQTCRGSHTHSLLVDPDDTFRGELVRIRPGATVTLSQILTALEPHERRLDWGPAQGTTMYEKFRDMNPHIALPLAPGGGVPASGDLRLSASAGNKPIRFFLPEGAASVLRRVGLDVIGDVETFDQRTYLLDESERTATDRAYEQLVRDAGQFGFTRTTQRRFEQIYQQLQTLAEQHPDSRYRQTQAKVARIHRSVWQTAGFRSLVATTETLLSVDPRVNMGREPVASAAPDSAPPRARPTVDPLPARPPRLPERSANR